MRSYNPLAAWPEGQIRSLVGRSSRMPGAFWPGHGERRLLLDSDAVAVEQWIVGGIKAFRRSVDQLKMMMVRDD
jgi:hypothetical protein